MGCGVSLSLGDEDDCMRPALPNLARDLLESIRGVRYEKEAVLPSPERGVSIEFLAALRTFAKERGFLDDTISSVRSKIGILTRETGISLVEAVDLCSRTEPEGAELRHRTRSSLGTALVGRATTYFCYTGVGGTRLFDVLDAIHATLSSLDTTAMCADDDHGGPRPPSPPRFVWIDFLAVHLSPSGAPADRVPADHAAAPWRAALEVCTELLLYCSPLAEPWTAPQHHAFLDTSLVVGTTTSLVGVESAAAAEDADGGGLLVPVDMEESRSSNAQLASTASYSHPRSRAWASDEAHLVRDRASWRDDESHIVRK